MIIALSGYAGAGKDAVASLIQYTIAKEKINLTLDELFSDEEFYAWPLGIASGWDIKRFSGKLKQAAEMLTGISAKSMDSQDVKRRVLDRCWWTTNEDGVEPMTVRDMLQKLGTDAIRDGLHPNAWVNALMADYVPLHHDQASNGSEYPNWIITDCRFPNEAKAVKERGGVVVRIDRPGIRAVNGHPSETALDDWDFDYRIMNGSDLVSLQQTIQVILNKIL